jgi:hypothetical protein
VLPFVNVISTFVKFSLNLPKMIMNALIDFFQPMKILKKAIDVICDDDASLWDGAVAALDGYI